MASTANPPIGEAAPSPLLPPSTDGRLRFSRTAYHRLADIGLLNEDSRVELIDGEIFMMSPIGPSQGGLITRLMNFFVTHLPESLGCRIQLPITAGDHSEPQPDIAVVRLKEDDYTREHPTPTDVVLRIDVAQSSLKFDLGLKLRLYAECGAPEYWVIGVDHAQVLAHRDPVGAQYERVEQGVAGSKMAPLAAPGCELDVAWLFH